MIDESRLLNGRLLKTLSISSPSPLSSSNSSSTPSNHLMSSLKITTTNLLPNKPMIDELPYDQSSLLLTTAKPLIKSTTNRDTTPTSSFANSNLNLNERPIAKRPTKLFDTEITPTSRYNEFYNPFPLKPNPVGSESHVLEGAKLNLIQRELNPYPSSRKSMHISMIPSSSSSSCSSSSLSTLSSLSTISTPPLSPSETLSSQGKYLCCGLINYCFMSHGFQSYSE